MKKFIAMFAASALVLSAFAQAPANQGKPGRGAEFRKQQKERIQAEKIAYITTQLELTPEEAQVFWPVYNKAQAELKEANKAVGEKMKAVKAAIKEGAADAEVGKLVKEYTKARGEKKDVMASYADQFIKVVGPVKTAKLYIAEEGFRKQQIGRLGGQGGGQRPGGPRPGVDEPGDPHPVQPRK